MKVCRQAGTWVVAVMLLIGVVGSGGCSRPAQPQQPAALPVSNPGTLVVATGLDTATLDPHVSAANTDYKVIYNLYDRLVTYKPGSRDVVSMIAREWECSPDALEWTFKLREDARFHDGTPVDAEAVRFSFQRMLKLDRYAAGMFKGVLSPEGVIVADRFTVKMKLEKPYGPFLKVLAINGAAIVPPSVLQHEKNGDLGQAWLAKNEIGSGPFKLESWQEGQEIVLGANKEYWGGPPKLEKVVVKFIKEPATQRMLLEKGDIDIAENITLQDVEALKTPGVKVAEFPGYHVQFVTFNTAKKPLNDPRVRRAIALALDYDAIVKGVMRGHATRSRGNIPSGMVGHDPTRPFLTQNLDEARRLMAEAGYKDGFSCTLKISTYPEWQPIAASMQHDLAQIGVKADIQQFALPTYFDMQEKGNTDISLEAWTPDYDDPLSLLWYWFWSGNIGPGCNYAFYRNAEVDRLLGMAQTETNDQKRAELYGKVDGILMEELPHIPLFEDNYILAMREWVKGYAYHPMMNQIFDFASISK